MVMIMVVVVALTWTALSGNGYVICICLQGKILQGVTVAGGIGRIALGKFDDLVVISSKVLDILSTNCWHVVKSMQEIRCPECIGGRSSDSVSQGTHLVQRAATLIAQVANHCLASSILTTPMAGPA